MDFCDKKGMANLTMQQKKEWAKQLILRDNLTQKEAAEKVQVSAVTMNKWYKDGEWEKLKQSMLITREAQLSRLYMQLDELNAAIMTRPEGERFANSKEIDAIAKYTSSIRSLESEANIADVYEVSKRVLNYVRIYHADKAIELAAIFDDFIKDLLKR